MKINVVEHPQWFKSKYVLNQFIIITKILKNLKNINHRSKTKNIPIGISHHLAVSQV
mgnify:CR=1 FL=1